MKYITTVGDEQYTVEINQDGVITVNGEVTHVDMRQMEDTTMYSIIIEGESHDIRMHQGEDAYLVQMSGEIFDVVVEDERTRRLAGLKGTGAIVGDEVDIKAPMPGVVVELPVGEGDAVEKGDIVVILESMKMQNEFKAPKAGVISTVRVSVGDKVDQNAVMVTISKD